jgi:hypothetical protein
VLPVLINFPKGHSEKIHCVIIRTDRIKPDEGRTSYKNSLKQEFEDTKGVTRIRKSEKNIVNRKSTNEQTKHTHKIKDRVTRTSLKPGGELRKCKQFLIQ